MTGGPPSRADHYSYSVYADPAMAEAFDALRFSGPIGRLLAETQERVIASFSHLWRTVRSSMLAPEPGVRRLRSPPVVRA